MNQFWAHSKNAAGKRQTMEDHLYAVAEEAAAFARVFGGSELARYLGMWHDVGKYRTEFQEYLLQAEINPRSVHRGPDHKAAGARIAKEQKMEPLMLPLQGHHGGLHDRHYMMNWFKQKQMETSGAIAIASKRLPSLLPTGPLRFPVYVDQANMRSVEFFLRMLFSALVDADFLDTERHFSPEMAVQRGGIAGITELWQRFEIYMNKFTATPDSSINRIRAEIYAACLDAAAQPPGFFRLSVPTGGGKTLSGMAFALRHAMAQGLQRVIVAVPYLTITQQTTSVYREIFEQDGDAVSPILEHHSAAGERRQEEDDYDPAEVRRRLAAENWDAPIVVTTTVQLLESLFANSTSRCRKLHRIAGSVIVLDEAQMLPVHLLDPILDVLQDLCTNYGASVVLSTATQPAYEVMPIFARVQAKEIVPEPQRYFAALKRVRYEWRQDTPLAWKDVADLMRAEKQVLCILNTKQNTLDLLNALDDPSALHLSTLLCGRHRSQVIQEVKARLAAGQPCRLVTTQVVEAGVDVDFPVVLRARAPLDSIIQAAGRANREGKLPYGRVVVFRPEAERLPGKAYERATEIGSTVLARGLTDLDDPAAIHQYFSSLYRLEDTDHQHIQDLRNSLDYPKTAHEFRLIDDDTVSVVVSFGDQWEREQVEHYWQELKDTSSNLRKLLRLLQPYTVSLYQHQARQYQANGWIQSSAVLPDVGLWLGQYHPVRGLVADLPADRLIF